jgi:hypothetical protein
MHLAEHARQRERLRGAGYVNEDSVSRFWKTHFLRQARTAERPRRLKSVWPEELQFDTFPGTVFVSF